MIYDIKRSGERIRRLRIQYGYTLAGKLNIDRSLISHVEAGKRGCSVDLLVRFSDLFNVSLDLLILGKEKSGLSSAAGRKQLKEDIAKLIEHLEALQSTL